MADVELAVQVIGLVQKGAGQEFFAGLLENSPLSVLRAHLDFVRTSHVLAEIGDAQAAFALESGGLRYE